MVGFAGSFVVFSVGGPKPHPPVLLASKLLDPTNLESRQPALRKQMGFPCRANLTETSFTTPYLRGTIARGTSQQGQFDIPGLAARHSSRIILPQETLHPG